MMDNNELNMQKPLDIRFTINSLTVGILVINRITADKKRKIVCSRFGFNKKFQSPFISNFWIKMDDTSGWFSGIVQ